ncbi:MAG: hypothetical protein GY804_03830 [Alphaproteobacteria bacterium]|nr:hypothetical protein [Alphaproteobacteria bacterium]
MFDSLESVVNFLLIDEIIKDDDFGGFCLPVWEQQSQGIRDSMRKAFIAMLFKISITEGI